jgi:nucleotide-binding universal stress UspA family protein
LQDNDPLSRQAAGHEKTRREEMKPMNGPILVATDFSTRSDRALRRSTMIAKESRTELLLVHVVDSDQPQYLIDAEAEASRSILEESARTACTIDDVAARANVVVGDVYSGILHAADEAGASLVVLGPHRRLLRDAFIGTTAERVIAHSRRPVLLAAGVPSAPYGQVLIALEMDDVSRSTVQRAQELGIVARRAIVAMHAFDAPAEGMMRRAMSDGDDIDLYVESERRQAASNFSAFLADVGLGGARQLLVPIVGTPARTILESARAEDASLVVVGTSQKTGIKRMVLGSVAEDVLGDAECDVLVIPEE